MSATTVIRSVALAVAVSWSVTAGATGSWTIWQDANEVPLPPAGIERDVAPPALCLVTLDRAALEGLLAQGPAETAAAVQTVIVELPSPMPDGTFTRFRIVDASIRTPEPTHRNPDVLPLVRHVRNPEGHAGDDGSTLAQVKLPSAKRLILRTFTAVTSPSRTFPRLADIIANSRVIGG